VGGNHILRLANAAEGCQHNKEQECAELCIKSVSHVKIFLVNDGSDCGCNPLQSSLQMKNFVSINQPLRFTFSAIDRTNCAATG
jgi:hypothetical protein